MIIKIVHHETVGEQRLSLHTAEAIPKQVALLDGVDEVEYEKVACHNAEELDILAEQFGSGLDGAWYGQEMPASNEHEDQAGGIESILMRVRSGGATTILVAVDSAVFFMNENGKTVDKVICR